MAKSINLNSGSQPEPRKPAKQQSYDSSASGLLSDRRVQVGIIVIALLLIIGVGYAMGIGRGDVQGSHTGTKVRDHADRNDDIGPPVTAGGGSFQGAETKDSKGD